MRKRQWINPRYEDDPRLKNLLAGLPATFDNKGTLIWNGRNKIRDIEGLIVKRFKHPSLLQQIGYLFRHHKARKAFDNGIELIRRGFDTPMPIAAAELWQGRSLEFAYYVSEAVRPDALAIELKLDHDDWDRPLAQAFAQYAAQLHEAGILHNDLNDTNVLYQVKPDGKYHFSLIDINRMKFYPGGKKLPTREWIENLTRFTGRLDLFEYVIREYAKVRGLDEESIAERAVEQKKQHDRNWYRRKRFLHAFKQKRKS